jgi:hypothetical protein
MVICLFVIGLAGAMVIRPIEVSKISENITGRDGTQTSQVTGQPTDFTKNYSDYYPGLIGLRRMSNQGPNAWTGSRTGLRMACSSFAWTGYRIAGRVL